MEKFSSELLPSAKGNALMKEKKTIKKTELKKPSAEDIYEVMERICTVSNVWAFSLGWEMENPRIFNKFMEMCAWFRKDEYYLSKKTNATTFWYHKKLKKDVLVDKITPDDMVVWWDENSRRWAHDKVTDFIFVAKGKH